jgi:predicted AlkP superfamily phosphohydrolase/phosphomutase
MDGGICINEWLWRHGWLVLKQAPTEGEITRFEDAEVDWGRTRAWASGGYYGRVFLNVQGREPQGCIPADACQAVRAELAAALAAIPDPSGVPLKTQVFEPERIYQQVNGVAPDLMVYFGDLHWRAVGSLGHDGIYTLENDTGPDDANHHPRGMFIYSESGMGARGRVERRQLIDVAPTLLRALGLPVPADLQGRDLVNR